MSERRYHVGDLPARLTREAREMLEGGEPLNLRALASRAGITAGSMYHHYENKAALLAELAARGFMELRQTLEQADREAGESGRLRSWAQAYFRFSRRSPALFKLMFDPEIEANAEVAKARSEALKVLERVVGEVIVTVGRPWAPADKIALAVWAAAHGAAVLAPPAADAEALVDDVVVGLDYLFRPPRK